MDDLGLDIVRNIFCIESIKGEILKNLGILYKKMADNSDNNELSAILSKVCLLNYLLAKKLGISYARLELDMLDLLKKNDLEYLSKEDVTSLYEHIGRRIKE